MLNKPELRYIMFVLNSRIDEINEKIREGNNSSVKNSTFPMLKYSSKHDENEIKAIKELIKKIQMIRDNIEEPNFFDMFDLYSLV